MNTPKPYSRREFIRNASLGTLAFSLGCNSATQKTLNLKFGHTFITWGYGPDVLEPAVKTISELGFYGFETFGEVIEEWETEHGGIGRLIKEYDIPIYSMFCGLNIMEKSAIKSEAEKMVTWCNLLKKYNGKVVVFTGDGERDENYNFKDHQDTIVEATNEYARIASDMGLTFAYHQHTDTPIEKEEEVYALMENVDTKVVKFGPDVGQLQKGGGDPVKILKDFLPILEHVHLKDYSGEKAYAGYAPLGMGKVDLQSVIKILEEDKYDKLVMVELDYGRNDPRPPEEAAKINKDYLVKLGYNFRS
jgi:inosose dehydratase